MTVAEATGVLAHPVAEYEVLGRRWLGVLGADRRVRSVAVAGSVARGTADRFSDLDLAVELAGCDLPGFTGDVERLARQVAPVFLVRMKRAGATTVCSVLTEQMYRVDLLLTAESSESPDELVTEPLTQALDWDVHEFLRVLALYPTVAERGEWLAAVDGAGLLRAALVRVAAAGSGLPRGNTRRLNAQLQADDRRRLERLPPLSASPADIAAFTAAVTAEFFTLAPAACARLGVEWPAQFALSAAAVVRPYLGDFGPECVGSMTPGRERSGLSLGKDDA